MEKETDYNSNNNNNNNNNSIKPTNNETAAKEQHTDVKQLLADFNRMRIMHACMHVCVVYVWMCAHACVAATPH